MKEGQEHIDKLFKKRLENPDHNLAYNEDDWDAFEQMLDNGKKRPVMVYWLPILSSVAAMALLFFGWWFFRAEGVTVKPSQQVAVKPAPHYINRDTSDKNKPQVAVPVNSLAVTPVFAGNNTSNRMLPVTKGNARQIAPSLQNTGEAILTLNGINASVITVQKNTVPPAGANLSAVQNDTVPPAKAAMVAMQTDTTPPAKITRASQGEVAQTKPEKVKVKTKSFGPNRPQYALSVIASSDINGVNSFQQSKVGSNFGALFSVSVKKWTITTGATYSIKPYATGFENYKTAYVFKQNPTNVVADCRMLDIPLNVAYRVYQKSKNKFSVGTGLSSYFMLHESYKYSYNAGATGPDSYNVANPKSYLLSVVNLNATFEHQVNSKFSLSVQPYMKLPITTVGYSQVNLHSAGVAVGFNWNLNSFTKPK